MNKKLQRALYAVAILALAAVACACVLGAIAAWELRRLGSELRYEMPQLSTSLKSAANAAGMSAVLIRQHADRDLNIIGNAASVWRESSKEQAAYWTDTGKKSGELLDQGKATLGAAQTAIESLSTSVKAIGTLAANTDYDLNEPGSGAIPSIQYDLHALTAKVGALAESLTMLSGHAQQIITDPEARQQLMALLRESSGAAADLHQATGDLKDAVHRATRPASFAVRFGGLVVNQAAKAGTILGGLWR